MKLFFSLIASFLLMAVCPAGALRAQGGADEDCYDLVIYGGTSAAVTTAVAAHRLGKSVIIVCPEEHLGGLTAGGLGWTDSGNKDAIGGISREFYHRVWKHYQQDAAWRWQDKSEFGNRNQSPPGADGDGATMWVFEPHVAERIFEEFIAECNIPVKRQRWLDRTVVAQAEKTTRGVKMADGRIQAIRTLSGETFCGKMFVDATYEGDLLAAAGVSYHVGREANSVYDESWNGVQVGVLHHRHWFNKPIDPYVRPGAPTSGLLQNVSSEPPGKRGEADKRIQAYCFRMCLTNDPANRRPFSAPEGYDAGQYELLLRVFDAGWREMFDKFDPIPNHKTDTNNHGPFSTDYIGMNYEYPEGSYARRREIILAHERYQKGLMYFMANDPRVPEDVREKMRQWGLAKDEFVDNNNWPHQIYVREARRLIGQYVMTEHDCLDKKTTPDSIGMGSYTLDSHNVQRYIKPDGKVQNEGDIGVKTPRPYEIALGSIRPKKRECKNLLVPVCVSSSHIAFGSIRMEPVFMILGQSAATVASLAIDQDTAVQEVRYTDLRKQLLADKQVLELDIPPLGKQLSGIAIDDSQAQLTGNWRHSTANKPFVGDGYLHNDAQPSEEQRAVFKTELSEGNYNVRIAWPVNANRAKNVPITVHHADGKTTIELDQTKRPPVDNLLRSVGSFRFSGSATVEIGTAGTSGYVVVDAVQFTPAD